MYYPRASVAGIELEKLTKIYPDGTNAVDRLDLNVEDGEFVVFVGPSGCGKTSALRMIAGLESISEGTLRIGGEVVNDLPPKARDVAMVFQNYALYPHMDVFHNMAFGLKMRRLEKPEIRRRVESAARVLGLSDVLRKRPRHLSGGQRQRVAMGRAIVREPKAFLLDEPLSNLDAKLRVQMRAEIARIQRDLQVTTIYVTHDQSEAMTLGDRVCVLRRGVLQQVARPQVLYESPTNLFVATFIGSPAMNVVKGKLGDGDGKLSVTFGPHTLAIPDAVAARRSRLREYAGREVVLGIRPEDINRVDDDGSAPTSRLDVDVDIREDMGSEILVHFAVDAPPVDSDQVKEVLGDEALAAEEEQLHHHGSAFVARFPRGTSLREGAPARLLVDTQQLHFFDPATGSAI